MQYSHSSEDDCKSTQLLKKFPARFEIQTSTARASNRTLNTRTDKSSPRQTAHFT